MTGVLEQLCSSVEGRIETDEEERLLGCRLGLLENGIIIVQRNLKLVAVIKVPRTAPKKLRSTKVTVPNCKIIGQAAGIIIQILANRHGYIFA